jgi:hypothetical protein
MQLLSQAACKAVVLTLPTNPQGQNGAPRSP